MTGHLGTLHPGPRRLRLLVVMLVALISIGVVPTTAAVFTRSRAASAGFTLDVLDPPTSLTCNGGGTTCNAGLTTRPALAWTATVDAYATGYRILRSTTSGSGYAQVAQVAGRSTTTWTDNTAGLSTLTSYYYVVIAYFDPWTSANSNEVKVTILLGL